MDIKLSTFVLDPSLSHTHTCNYTTGLSHSHIYNVVCTQRYNEPMTRE